MKTIAEIKGVVRQINIGDMSIEDLENLTPVDSVNFSKRNFSEEQIEQINEGITKGGAPDGYTWHHDAETGKMQLVDSDLHGDSRHTGGRAIWGGGSEFR